MSTEVSHALPRWSIVVPFAGVLIFVVALSLPLGSTWLAFIGAALIAAVVAAIHHAEVIAHKVGEPFGTLILAVAVTVIEASLIVSVMLSGGPTAPIVARDSVYAAVMIVSSGIIGVCLLVGGLRHHVTSFRVEGTGPALAVLAALAGLTLVLPVFTVSVPGPRFSEGQLIFAGVESLILYGVFVFVQTVRHRDYFLPVVADDPGSHAPPPSSKIAWAGFALLCVSLIAVVGLAKNLAPAMEEAVHTAGLPTAIIGVAIAALVLLPETGAAVRAAYHNRIQNSLNLALGSALATIGLTIPVVAFVSTVFDLPLEMGLSPKDIVLLAITLFVAALTLAGGTATLLQGAVHLVLFFAFLFLTVFP